MKSDPAQLLLLFQVLIRTYVILNTSGTLWLNNSIKYLFTYYIKSVLDHEQLLSTSANLDKAFTWQAKCPLQLTREGIVDLVGKQISSKKEVWMMDAHYFKVFGKGRT